MKQSRLTLASKMDFLNTQIINQYQENLKPCILGCVLVFCSLFTENSLAQNLSSNQDSDTNNVITYCVDPSWQPYEALEQQKHSGISSDYLQYFIDFTGIKLKLIQTSSWVETLELLKSGHCHLTPMLNESENRKKYLSFSDTYFTAPNVLVSLREEPFLQNLTHVENRSVAIVKGYRLIDYIQKYFPNIKLTFVDNETEGLKLVSEGEIKLFIGSMLSVNHKIKKGGLSKLKIAGWAGPEDKLKLAVIKSKQKILPMINQAIASITESRHLDIYRKWQSIEVTKTTNYALWWQSIAVISVLFLLILLRQRSINKYNVKLRKKNNHLNELKNKLEIANQKLKFSANHDPLTQLYNRQYFNETLEKDHREHKEGVTLTIIDIDYFKDINDKFGHSAGDQILQALSKILTLHIRETDFLARWGGEEFVIVSKQSNLNSANQLSIRIQKAISEYNFPYCKTLSCSFGIAEHTSKENILHCFERADQALYKAKKQGRNQICHD